MFVFAILNSMLRIKFRRTSCQRPTKSVRPPDTGEFDKESLTSKDDHGSQNLAEISICANLTGMR